MSELTQLSATDLAARIQSGACSAVDALAASRAQVEAREAKINAFVTLDWDAAEARARELDAVDQPVGPLHGVPIAIKDCFETKGLRTTWGSKSYANHVPAYDALHVKRLRDAGAVIIGKTNTPEFTFSGQTTNLVAGTTRNPLDPGKTVAGSSGGAAAALAANMVALADGSDLGGSARSPAAWCGVVGMRPSSGLVPYDPNPAPFDGLSVPGPMARDVRDLTLMLSVMQGNTARQPLGFWSEMPDAETLETPLPPGRVAFSLAPFGAEVDPSIQAAIAPVADLLGDMGWRVEDAAPDLAPLLPHGDLVRGLCALQIRTALRPDMAKASDSFRTACAAGEAQGLPDLLAYQHTRALVWRRTAEFFTRYDFALWPTTTGLAFGADLTDGEITEDWRTVTLTPMLELPSISIPCGTSSDGMPVGLHITGPKGSDANLLRFARGIERALTGDIS